MSRFHQIICLLFVLFAGVSAGAGELHAFLLNGCTLETGLVVNIDGDEITLIDLQGRERQVDARQVTSIYIYTYFDNPLPSVTKGPGLTATLKRIVVQEGADDEIDNTEEFLGWPVRFVESLFMFYDTSGNVRVYDRDRLLKVRPVTEIPDIHFMTYRPVTLDYRGLSTQCSNLGTTGANSIRPTRIMTDKIKVDQYLSDMSRGYQDLANFQERTYLYARPFLYEKRSRTTFFYRDPQVERQLDLGIGTQWSTGTPYHFQSYNRLGVQPMEFTPQAMPVFGFRSDVKAHIFHAHFSGDFRGLSGGSQVFGLSQADDTDKYGGLTEVQTAFNYLILMGADYGPVSLSAGYFYPVFYLRSGASNREVLASRRNYLLRAMWTTSRWRWRAVVSPIHFEAASPSRDDLRVGPDSQVVPTQMAFDGYFWRAGADFDWSHSRQVSADLLVTKGDYRETLNGTSQSFKFTKTAAILSARQDFGDYVGLRLTETWFHFQNNANFENGALNADHNELVAGGTLEFIF